MLDTLATPHGYPGRLIVVEGIDGSGKTTQLLAKWLAATGHRVSVTEWNSSALVRTAVRTGKRKNVLTPTTFSLLHATDFADRQLYKIIPPLKAGMAVLADRYAYTAFARDVARGVNRQWVRDLYSFAVRPDLVGHFRVSVDVALERLIARQVKLKFYEAGMDMGWSQNASSNTLNPLTFVLLYACDFADRMEKEIIPALSSGFIVIADRYIAAMSKEFDFRVIDGRMPIDTIQEALQRQVGTFLDAQPSMMDPELRSCG